MSWIPSFHFIPAEDKLKPKFCMDVVNYYIHSTSLVSLLDGKDIHKIEQYSTGHIDMTPFKRMFTSLNKALKSAQKNIDGTVNQNFLNNFDKTGLSWEPLALIPQKLNSAIA